MIDRQCYKPCSAPPSVQLITFAMPCICLQRAPPPEPPAPAPEPEA